MNPWQVLRRKGVLGINERNVVYTQGENPRHLYPLVDDKLKTKALCQAVDLPVAAVLAKAEQHADVKSLIETLRGRGDFVLKPARGAMGNGILVVGNAEGDGWLDSNDRPITSHDLAYHSQSIVSGLYALAGQRDVAFAEERLHIGPEFERVVNRGVPDVRIIVFRGVPVMAMTRLPTRRSSGKANLHLGAVGAGIDLTTGRTNFAVIRSTPIETHPDTQERVVDFDIPRWREALEAALFATDQTGLGYLGADVVIDADRGPMILELNARPGLAIQLANRAGLLPRLEAIARESTPGATREDRTRLGLEIARRTTT
jgi:alpha-L-glutamate ligase-like protein